MPGRLTSTVVWKERKDVKTGRAYYVNLQTKKTTWTRPDESTIIKTPAKKKVTKHRAPPKRPGAPSRATNAKSRSARTRPSRETKPTASSASSHHHRASASSAAVAKKRSVPAKEKSSRVAPHRKSTVRPKRKSTAASSSSRPSSATRAAQGTARVWREKLDKKSGKKYYVNVTTKKTRWKKPAPELIIAGVTRPSSSRPRQPPKTPPRVPLKTKASPAVPAKKKAPPPAVPAKKRAAAPAVPGKKATPTVDKAAERAKANAATAKREATKKMSSLIAGLSDMERMTLMKRLGKGEITVVDAVAEMEAAKASKGAETAIQAPAPRKAAPPPPVARKKKPPRFKSHDDVFTLSDASDCGGTFMFGQDLPSVPPRAMHLAQQRANGDDGGKRKKKAKSGAAAVFVPDDGTETKMEWKSTDQLEAYEEEMLQQQLPSIWAPSRFLLLQLDSALYIGKGASDSSGLVGSVEGGRHLNITGGLTELLKAGEKKQSSKEKLPALIAGLDDMERLNLMKRMGQGLSIDDAVLELERGSAGGCSSSGSGDGAGGSATAAAATATTALRFCVAEFAFNGDGADELDVAEGERLIYLGAYCLLTCLALRTPFLATHCVTYLRACCLLTLRCGSERWRLGLRAARGWWQTWRPSTELRQHRSRGRERGTRSAGRDAHCG